MVFQTVKLALAQCRANAGDIILIAPGHTESITNATDLNVNVAGVRIISLGAGTDRGTFTLTTAVTATITVSAANCVLSGLVVDMTGFASITAGINVTAAGVTLVNNSIILSNATNSVVLGVSATATATNMSVTGNFFSGVAVGTTTTAVQVVGANDVVVRNNNFVAGLGAGVGAISCITTDGLRFVIDGNYINNLTAVSTKAISVTAGSTGIIANNRMQILSGIAPITGAAMSWVGGNYWSAVIGTAGALI